MTHLVLVGLMGAGKTSVGRLCAERLGRPFVDTDDVVESLAQMPVADIFATAGEARFRELERQAVADVCASPEPLVIACGGGAAVDPENRKRLKAAGTVVWLRAPVGVLAARVGDDASRPLLAGGSPELALSRLAGAREASYQAAADYALNTEGRTIDQVATDVLLAFEPHAHVRVDLGERSYAISIANNYTALGLRAENYRRVAVVTDANVDAACGDLIRGALRDVSHETFVMGSGEDAKSLATVEDLCRRLAQWGLLRGDLIVAAGGGVVGDTAGFVAASYYRGIDVAQVPTTLLAMVDSAIGGKTGVNLPEGKNLVGAFHQPIGVYANPRVLASLPEREYKCGLGEIAKYALMENLTLDADALVARDPAALTDVIAQSAAIKARYVAADEFERTGTRAVLNYGHTLAHALETATGHALLHGEAVAIGLVFAGQLAGALERIDPKQVDAHTEIVAGLGLPTTAPSGLRADDLLPIMARDKKSGGGLTFMLAGPSGIERVDDPDMTAVRKAFAAVNVEA